MNYFNILTGISFVVLLSACGGGGSSQPGNSSNDATVGSRSFTVPFANQAATAKKDQWVGLLIISNAQKNDAQVIVNSDRYSLSTNNKVFNDIPNEPSKARNINGINGYGNPFDENNNFSYKGNAYKFFMISDSQYKNVQFGLGRIAGDNSTIISFFRGQPTKLDSMPVSGSAIYEGVFLTDPHINDKTDSGKVYVNVDFAKKNLSFLARSYNGYAAAIEAKISGNTFSGMNDEKEVMGIFAGDAAKEISGQFVDKKANLYSVFGAIKN